MVYIKECLGLQENDLRPMAVIAGVAVLLGVDRAATPARLDQQRREHRVGVVPVYP
jgi:hypothetical protein